MSTVIAEVYKLSVHLCVGLVILMIVNLVLDSLDDFFNKAFEWKKLREGVLRGTIVLLCFLATYFVGYINKDIVDISVVKGQRLDLMDAVALMTITAYYFYARQVVTKLFDMIAPDRKKDDQHK